MKSALVLGLGVSGLAAAGLLLEQGLRVTVVDCAGGGNLATRAGRLRGLGAEVFLETQAIPAGDFDLCVVSPGIGAECGWIGCVESRGIEVISELELGAMNCPVPMLAVSGSNGKSTMVKLCAEALVSAGLRAESVGNYGVPLCDIAGRGGELDWVVVEVSSFQLEKVREFKPAVAVLLNVQPDHLDRHGDMSTYRQLKARLFDRMQGGDTGIVLDIDADEIGRITSGRPRWVTFGLSPGADHRYGDGRVCFRTADGEGSASLRGTLFDNCIMGLTAAAAVAAARCCGISADEVGRAAGSFRSLPHRMMELAAKNGVRFVDDSKATNLSALRAALEMCEGNVRLIAGGILKEGNLKSLQEILAKKTCKAYLIGNAAAAMCDAWGDVVDCGACLTLDKAVAAAWDDAGAGDTILLSPGCASFDQFRSFAERGERFGRLVELL